MKWRISVLCFIVTLLSFLSFGTVKEFGNDIQYPAQAAFSIIEGEGVNREQVLSILEGYASDQAATIYHPFLSSTGQQKTFIIGKNSNKNDNYTSDKTELANNSLTGMYYLDADISSDLEEKLSESGLIYKGASIPWVLLPIYFLFTNLRSLAVWTSFFVFAILLFSVKLLYIKKAMIQRSLGLFWKQWRLDFICEGISLLTLSALYSMIFIIFQEFRLTVFAKSFIWLLLINLMILLVIDFLVNILFAVHVRLGSASLTLKNKKSSPLILYVWLMGILASCFIFNMTLSESLKTITSTHEHIQVLNHWKVAGDYSSITWLDIFSGQISENGEIDASLMAEESQKNRHFVTSLSDDDMIYAQASSLKNSGIPVSNEVQNRLDQANVDTSISENIYYVNKGFMLKNQSLYPANQYGDGTEEGLGIVYIPQSQMGKRDSILALIDFENFQYTSVTANDFVIREIPDNQKTFLFNHSLSSGELFSKQEVEDAILVELHFTQLPQEAALETLFSNVTVNGIFKEDGLKDKLDGAKLSHYSAFTNVANYLLLEKDKISSQLLGTIISLIMLAFVQLFVVYEYVITILQNRAKKISILSLLGRSYISEILTTLSPIILGIIIISVVTYYTSHSSIIVNLILIVYLLEILFMSIYALKIIKQKRIQIMKGDFEIV